MDLEARTRTLSTWLSAIALFLLIMAIKSRAWVILHGDWGHVDLGLWNEQGCDSQDCDTREGSDAEDGPRNGALGLLTLVLGIGVGAALIHQGFGGRGRHASYLAGAAIAVATYMVFRKEAALPGPAYVVFMLGCLSALLASVLRPDPPVPVQIVEVKAGGSFMKPPDDPPPP